MEGSYGFIPAELSSKNYASKEIEQLFTKWLDFECMKMYCRGLKDNLKLKRFRFDQEFKQVNLDDFLKDLFNNPSVKSELIPALNSFAPAVKEVKFSMLSTNVTSMDFFDPLEKYGITGINGYIKKSMDEYINDVEVSDRLRYCRC